MTAPAGPDPVVGAPIDRVDGFLKVTGGARFAAEMPATGLVHGVMVQSRFAAGQLGASNRDQVEHMPGVLLVLTHENAPRLPVVSKKNAGDQSVRALSLLQDATVHYNGEPIAVVLAETLEQATDAAHQLRFEHQEEQTALDMNARMHAAYPSPSPPPQQGEAPTPRGDVESALASAPVQLDLTYTTPMEHHNAMEPHAVVTVWERGNGTEHLTVYDTTQGVSASHTTVAQRLGLRPEQVRIVSHFVGGGFGSKGSTWSHVILAAMASRVAQRPVKLAVTRRQMFGPVGGRPRTVQRLRIGARKDGELVAMRHDCVSSTSVMEDWTEPSATQTRMLYATPNLDTSQRLVALNVGVPTFQRAPGESTGTFALESAMDELAHRLGIDPLALRLRNYAESDPDSGHPWSSKQLRECYRRAAERFGWQQRRTEPMAMRRGHTLVGYGMATATYPSRASKSSCKGSMALDRTHGVIAEFEAGTQELGTGTYTVMTQIIADALGLPVERVRFRLGESGYPETPISGGSQTAASTGSSVHAAATALKDKLIALATADSRSPVHQLSGDRVQLAHGRIEVQGGGRGETLAALLARQPGPVAVEATWTPPEARKAYSTHAFGAVFAEVHIDDDTREVRVPRIVAAYGVNPLNRKTAESQLIGGIVWAVGMALTEESRLDLRNGRFVNADLAEYHVPVNADVQALDVIMVPEPDLVVNPVGAKGIGEIGITGATAAIANAVFNATGIRVRDLPITPDKLLS
jgi:xanthine dehydrogenase YagR molybdenum-binding subunit